MRYIEAVIAVTLAAGLLLGCSSKYRTDSYQAPTLKLSTREAAYVMVANDGVYGGKTYAGSGRATSQATMAAVAKHLNRVVVATGPEPLDDALAKAQSAGQRYVFQPQILNWEDRATEWSGRPDRITIKIVVWDSTTKQELALTLPRASSKWATFGGDHPQDLLPGAIGGFVDQPF